MMGAVEQEKIDSPFQQGVQDEFLWGWLALKGPTPSGQSAARRRMLRSRFKSYGLGADEPWELSDDVSGPAGPVAEFGIAGKLYKNRTA